MRKNYKFGFTLAEVLITLGIIGVVAAITIPSLINNYKAKKLRSQFLKSYSVVQQAFKLMEADDVSLDPSTYKGDFLFYRVFMNYLTGATDCQAQAGAPSSSICFDASNNSDVDINSYYRPLHGATNTLWKIRWLLDDGQIALQDGTLLLFENASVGKVYVSVDINGHNNKPNILGYDLFTFQFLDGELKTMGDKGTDYTDMNTYCNPKSTDILNGIACAQKAKEDTDYFKKIIKEFK